MMAAMATRPAAARGEGGLIARLRAAIPGLRGRLTAKAPLAGVTWFRVGGPAEVLFKPADEDDLAAFLAGCPADVPLTVMGVASNLLVRDGGVPGVVIRLGRAFAEITVDPPLLSAGAAALDLNVARRAAEEGRAGLEFLSGIPGTVGGALRMNAGAYGSEVKDVLVMATALDRRGQAEVLGLEAMQLGYRHCGVPADRIFTGAVFSTTAGRPADIAARMTEIGEARGATQPVRSRTGGSTFANPPGHKAWQLIDAAGCRGLRLGGAQVSEQHTNFLINTGDATAADLEGLGELVRSRVFEQSGIDLRWEIRRIGVPAGEAVAESGGGGDG
jgi:UDP-N-acetylmuramate dehydrogenase